MNHRTKAKLFNRFRKGGKGNLYVIRDISGFKRWTLDVGRWT
jgi:hypothetical protein